MYEQKEYEELFEVMLEDSVEKGLISHATDFKACIKNHEDISNYYVMDKSVIAKMFATFYEDLTKVHNSINVNIADGSDLDNLGDIVGVKRPHATYAMCDVTFRTNNSSGRYDINIEDELVVSTNNGIKYRTLESIHIPVNKSECVVPCIAVESGVKSKVAENSLVNIEDTKGHKLTCYNVSKSSGGNEEYNDKQYRELLMNWRLINLKGSKEAYDYYFNTFDGLDGYKVIPNWNGTGTIKIILDPGTPFMLNSAYEDLQNTVSQASEDITMFAPTSKAIDIYAIVNVDIDQINPYSNLEKENIKSRIIIAIKLFIDGGYRIDGSYYGGLNIGEDFIPHKLAVFLDEEIPELKNIDFNYPNDYLKIADEEIGVSNSITVEMV